MTTSTTDDARRIVVEAKYEERVATVTLLTVKEYAAQERVVTRTVRRWIDKGAIRVRRTPGGQIRIPVRMVNGDRS